MTINEKPDIPFMEAPFIAQGDAVTGQPRRFPRSFWWLTLAHATLSVAFWAYYGAVFAEASNRFGAGPSDMAVLGAALSVPFILGAVIQGFAVDRWSPKWLMIAGEALVLVAIPIAMVAQSLPYLWVSSLVVGAGFGMVEPARSALTGLLVPSDDLVSANGHLSIAFQTALIIASFGGGALLDLSGYDAVYLAALGVGSLPLIFASLLPDVRQQGAKPEFKMADLRRGAITAWHHTRLRILLMITAGGWLLINTFFILEPLFVKHTLGLPGSSLLYLWGVHGAGALVGAIWLARADRMTGKEAVLVCCGIAIIGAGITVYAGGGMYSVALMASAANGAGFALLFPPLLAYIQRVVTEDQRGRVTSVFVAMQESAGLLSSLILLALGTLVVVRPTLILTGVALAVAALVALRAILAAPEPQVQATSPTGE